MFVCGIGFRPIREHVGRSLVSIYIVDLCGYLLDSNSVLLESSFGRPFACGLS